MVSVQKHNTGKNYYPVFKEMVAITREERNLVSKNIRTELEELGFERTGTNTFLTGGLGKKDIVELLTLSITQILEEI